MKKAWGAFWAGVMGALLLAGAPFIIAAFFPPERQSAPEMPELAAQAFSATAAFAVRALLAAGAALFIIWWTAYFIRLSYRCENGALFIRCGVFFVRERAVPLREITALTRVSLRFSGRHSLPLLCVVRTAGGNFVIFAEFSTKC